MEMYQGGRQELVQLAHSWITEGWQKGNVEAAAELHTADFIDHASAGRATDRTGFLDGIRELYRAFPDFHAVIEDLVVDEPAQKVVVRWTAVGTHQGDFMGFPATGRPIRFRGIEIICVQAGRVSERWGEWDAANLLDQFRAP